VYVDISGLHRIVLHDCIALYQPLMVTFEFSTTFLLLGPWSSIHDLRTWPIMPNV